ncbi:hypothetical protein N180_03180 [Pedobacter antarcticus 4BY]|uniref:histidine kinase n=2 Tax=Pedobacter antarcticus TaxID=34086 RepID=A0A081PKP1_9SPHI|nr:hypothetical protein N180_03180 [Pedobacter antarcticus 4BY]
MHAFMDEFKELNYEHNALRLAEERNAMFAAIVDSSDDAIISKDLQGVVTSWNPAAKRIFGYTAEEMIGQPILKIIPADRLGEEIDILTRLRRGDRVEHFETRRMAKSGRLLDISLTISPIRDYFGGIIGISKIARDITLLKQAEEKSAVLAAIVDSTDDAVISKDLQGIITSWNISAERIFGFTAQEIIGESILKLIPEDRKEEEYSILAQLKAGRRVDHIETKRLTKDGRLVDVSLTISPVKDTKGNIIGISKIARDITEKKLEEQRKNDFIAIVSHELKTPLTSVRSYVQLALLKARQRGDLYTEKVLSRAENQTVKMTSLIHDFLDLSRLDEGKMALNLSRFSLPLLMNEIVDEAVTLAPLHQISYQLCEEVHILADREKISQVMTNLLSNAVKYSPAGTTVTVSCLRVGNAMQISFADQGIGVSPADQKRLFERFYRVNNEQMKNVSGFGIGLYLVTEILRMHGSVIELQSQPGQGSVFSFSLPVQ